MSKRGWLSQLDHGFLGLLLLLSAFGVAVLWSASHESDGSVAPFAVRQLQWLAIAFAAMVCVVAFDYHHFRALSLPLYLCLLLMLVGVLAFGRATMGAQRWLALGPIKIQPSEFIKVGIAVIVSHLLAREEKLPPYGLKTLWLPIAATLVPIGLVLVQPDLGTAVLVGAVAASIILFHGVRRNVLIGLSGALLVGAPAGWAFLKDYQRQRILTFLDPERDPLGAGYHIIQSKIAVGSGQLLGKGFLHGTQARLRFLPERHTDFIFSVLAEEWGFVGTLAVLALYALLILWGLDIAAKARDTFGRLLAVGVTSILFFHVAVNIGMVTGCLPVVGVPLPLFSYGGSSVLTTYLVAGILLSIRLRRFSKRL
ncbi:MAG: rod shape-determining protein RodA [Deltaproteobacteria bacterium]|nr:rod shape-determining protein RodA [Deltaproteobacteria bacterium]